MNYISWVDVRRLRLIGRFLVKNKDIAIVHKHTNTTMTFTYLGKKETIFDKDIINQNRCLTIIYDNSEFIADIRKL